MLLKCKLYVRAARCTRDMIHSILTIYIVKINAKGVFTLENTKIATKKSQY